MSTPPRILCIGEALVDVVDQDGAVDEHVGGSLLNVTCGLARLDHDATIQAWFGRDERGHRLREWAISSGARIAPGSEDAERTPVAYATVDRDGQAEYTFDLQWRIPTAPEVEAYGHLHTGSIACTLEPGGSAVVDAVRRIREHGTVSYDPNVRPALMGEPQAVMGRIEELIGLADVVKASDEDIAWLYGEMPLEAVVRRWKAMGPGMIVITRGPRGALAALAGEQELLGIDQITVAVGDTVGAGDSFMAGLVSGLTDAGLLGTRAAAQDLERARWSQVQPALHRAVATSAITVGHTGAYAPDRAEVQQLLENRPPSDDEPSS